MILITGGLGFIGSSLAYDLVVNCKEGVRILTQSVDKKKNIIGIEDKVDLRVKDITDINESDMDGVRCIFHCASTGHNYHIHDDPYIDIDTNCRGTIAVLEAMRKYSPVSRMVNVSTFFVNGNPEQLPVTPQAPCNPMGLYGATKLAAEHFCSAYSRVFGLHIVTARLTNVYGPRENGYNSKKAAMNRMIRIIAEGGEVNVYNPSPLRDYIYIDDVVNGLVCLAHSNVSGTYYIGTGEGVEVKQIIETAISIAGMGKMNLVVPPTFHEQVGMGNFWCDNTPMRSLGWKSLWPIEDGLHETIRWFSYGE